MSKSVTVDVAQYLQTLGFGAYATNLFADELPDTPDDCVAVIGFNAPTPEIAGGGIAAEHHRFQVIVRASTRTLANEKAHDIYATLTAKGEVTINSTNYKWFAARTAPVMDRDMDELHRSRWRCEFDAVRDPVGV